MRATDRTAMYAITIICSPKPGYARELIDACLKVVEPSRAEPGNLFFDVLVREDLGEIVFYEAYVDEAAFDAHMEAPHTKAWKDEAFAMVDESTIRLPAHRSVAPAPGSKAGDGG